MVNESIENLRVFNVCPAEAIAVTAAAGTSRLSVPTGQFSSLWLGLSPVDYPLRSSRPLFRQNITNDQVPLDAFLLADLYSWLRPGTVRIRETGAAFGG
jgi:hypothetical protein